MSSNDAHRIGMFEVLIDENKSDSEQLVIDWGELAVSDIDASLQSQNYGPIRLGGGHNYLLTTHETFSLIKGYTICPYDQVVKLEGSTTCSQISQASGQKMTLNPFDNTETECFSEGNFSTNE